MGSGVLVIVGSQVVTGGVSYLSIVRVQAVTGSAGYLKGQLITGGAGYCKGTGCDRECRLSQGTGFNLGMQVIVRVQVVTGVQVNRLIGGCWLFQGVHFIAGGNSHFIKVIRVQVGARGSSHRRSAGKGKGADGCRGVGIKQ